MVARFENINISRFRERRAAEILFLHNRAVAREIGALFIRQNDIAARHSYIGEQVIVLSVDSCNRKIAALVYRIDIVIEQVADEKQHIRHKCQREQQFVQIFNADIKKHENIDDNRYRGDYSENDPRVFLDFVGFIA